MSRQAPLQDSRPLGALALSFYAVAAMMILLPLWELVASTAFRFEVGNVAWRTGIVGLASGSLGTSVFGLLVATATAYGCGHRRTFGVLTGLLGFVCVAIVGILVLFTLDVLQLRHMVAEKSRRAYDVSVVKAYGELSTYFCVTGAMTLAGVRALRNAWPNRIVAQKRAPENPVLIVGAPRSDAVDG